MSVVLTLDVDWAIDEVVADSFELIAASGARATWFATHETPILTTIRSSGHEIGLHPNFNPLLEQTEGSMREVFERVKALAPDAHSVRSHSLTRSSRMSQMFRELGMTHESNMFIPPHVGTVQPWRDWIGMVQVPIRWEDDVKLLDDTLGEPASLLGSAMPTVDFHPIHVFLNCISIEDYESTRQIHRDHRSLLERRRPSGSGGTRDLLESLLKATAARNEPMLLIREVEPAVP